MINRILTGSDKARELGHANLRAMLLALAQGRNLEVKEKVSPKKVYARIDFGRWLADCECGGAGYVDPSDPVFFCVVCGNVAVHGVWRQVEFPADREAIELEVLRRPVEEPANLSPVDTAIHSRSLVPGLSRSWRPGESVEQLAAQVRAALKVAEV